MKLSRRWIAEWVDLDGIATSDLARRLTFHTAEIEAVEEMGRGLDGVVTARVTAVRPHPDADRLRLCTVDTGSGEPREVVCGAPNVAEGQVICYAAEGVTLPNGLTLERRKIRGVESRGMILAEDEMGLGDDHDGIVVLPEGTPVGAPAADVLGAFDDVLDVENAALTHRPDLWGHVGFAREVGALYRRPFEPPSAERARAALAAAEGDPFPIDIQDEEGCRRYVGVVLEGLENGPSPEPLKRRLENLGVRSIDRLVDLTNLVMLEQGQPLHAFDLRDLKGDRIIVRAAADGETMRTLDGIDRVLGPSDLVIADGERPVAIAGVLGGEDSEVRADTTAILLESATFDASRVRRTAARLGIRTEASTRFEKSLDPESALSAAERFTELALQYLPGARVTRRLADAFPRPLEPVTVRLPYDLVQRRLGARITDQAVRESLTGLGFRLQEERNHLVVSVPSWRATKDVSIPEDLVEEVGRIRGYERIPEAVPVGRLTPHRLTPLRRMERRIALQMALDLGYAEVKTYAFYGADAAEALGLADVRHLAIRDPLTTDHDRLAQTAVPALLGVVDRNIARRATGRVFETTRLVAPGAPGRTDETTPAAETRVLTAACWDRDGTDDPAGRLFLDLVTDVRRLLEAVPIFGVSVTDGGRPLAAHLPEPSWLHPGRVATVTSEAGQTLGVVGEVAPRVMRAFSVSGRVVVLELDLDACAAAAGDVRGLYQPVHRYPVTPFDVAVIVPRRTPAAEVVAVVAAAAEGIRGAQVFDVYEGEGIPEGHRSIAVACELFDAEGTLAPADADARRQVVLAALSARGWTVRTAS